MKKLIRLITLLTVVGIIAVPDASAEQPNTDIQMFSENEAVALSDIINQRDNAYAMKTKKYCVLIESIKCHLRLFNESDHIVTDHKAYTKLNEIIDIYFLSTKSEEQTKMSLNLIKLIGFSEEDFCECIKNLCYLQIETAICDVQIYRLKRRIDDSMVYKDAEIIFLNFIQSSINILPEDPQKNLKNHIFAEALGFSKVQFDGMRNVYLKLLFVEKRSKELQISKSVNPACLP